VLRHANMRAADLLLKSHVPGRSDLPRFVDLLRRCDVRVVQYLSRLRDLRRYDDLRGPPDLCRCFDLPG